jgi:hypothetical protein
MNILDKITGDKALLRSIGNTTIKIVNNTISYIDSKINSKLVEPLKMLEILPMVHLILKQH